MKKELQIFMLVIMFCFITALFNKFLGFDYAFISAVTTIYWTLLSIKHKDK